MNFFFIWLCFNLRLNLEIFFAPTQNLPDNPLQKCSRLHRVMQPAAMRNATACIFFTGLPIPGCLAHIPKINANFATLTRPFLPFQTGGQFLYKPMNNMTEKQLKTEKQ